MILLPLHQIVWSGHLVNDPLSSLLHLPLFEAEETVLQVWPLMYTFGQEKLSKLGKAKDWNNQIFFYLNRCSLLREGRRCVEGTGKGLAGQGPQQRCCLHAFYLLIWNNSKMRTNWISQSCCLHFSNWLSCTCLMSFKEKDMKKDLIAKSIGKCCAHSPLAQRQNWKRCALFW